MPTGRKDYDGSSDSSDDMPVFDVRKIRQLGQEQVSGLHLSGDIEGMLIDDLDPNDPILFPAPQEKESEQKRREFGEEEDSEHNRSESGEDKESEPKGSESGDGCDSDIPNVNGKDLAAMASRILRQASKGKDFSVIAAEHKSSSDTTTAKNQSDNAQIVPDQQMHDCQPRHIATPAPPIRISPPQLQTAIEVLAESESNASADFTNSAMPASTTATVISEQLSHTPGKRDVLESHGPHPGTETQRNPLVSNHQNSEVEQQLGRPGIEISVALTGGKEGSLRVQPNHQSHQLSSLPEQADKSSNENVANYPTLFGQSHNPSAEDSKKENEDKSTGQAIPGDIVDGTTRPSRPAMSDNTIQSSVGIQSVVIHSASSNLETGDHNTHETDSSFNETRGQMLADAEKSDSDDKEVAELERNAMCCLNDVITADEEAYFLQMLDDEMTKAEEADFMEKIYADISAAEEREKIRKSQTAIVDEEDSESWEPLSKTDVPLAKTKTMIEYEEIGTLVKRLPKNLCGRPFIDQKLLDELRKAMLLYGGYYVALEEVNGSNHLTVYGDIVSDSGEVLRNWLQRALFRHNWEALEKFGEEMNIEMDAALPIGATMKNIDERLMLWAKEGTRGETAIKELIPWLQIGSVALLDVDGKACSSIFEFKKRKEQCVSEGQLLKMRLLRHGAKLTEVWNSTKDTRVSCRPKKMNSGKGTGMEPPELTVDVSPVEDLPHGDSRSDASVSYLHFKAKFRPVALLEFKNADIGLASTISSMWKQHKTLFGKECDSTCECVFKIDALTRNIIRDKLRGKKAWGNPLNLKKDDCPVGFAKFFGPKFIEYLKQEHPGDSPHAIFKRLCEMWDKHQQTRAFGLKCSKSCACLEGWETIFKKGVTEKEAPVTDSGTGPPQKKQRLDRSKPGLQDYTQRMKQSRHPSSETHGSVDSPTERNDVSAGLETKGRSTQSAIPVYQGRNAAVEPCGLPNPGETRRIHEESLLCERHSKRQRTVYSVEFKSSEPMGFYFVNEDGKDGPTCKIKSVCPKTSNSRDSRIGKGTTVCAVTAEDGCRIPISKWQSLRDYYDRARDACKDLRVFFINLEAPAADRCSEEEKNSAIVSAKYNKEWNADGKWRGSARNGWAGGAFCVNRVARLPIPRVAELEPNAIPPAMDVVEMSEKPEDNEGSWQPNDDLANITSFEDHWQMVDYLRPLVKTRPPSIVVRRVGTPDRVKKKKSVGFKENEEARLFAGESPPNLFYVERSQANSLKFVNVATSNGKTMIESASLSSSLVELTKLLNSGASSAITLEEFKLMLESISNTKADVRDQSGKVSLLKIFIKVIDIARQSFALKDWMGFQIDLLRIKSIFSNEYMESGSETIVAEIKHWQLYEDESRTLFEKSLSRNECQDFKLRQPFQVFHNRGRSLSGEFFRVLQFELRRSLRSGDWESIGCCDLMLESLFKELIANERKPFLRQCHILPLNSILESSSITIGVKKLSSSDLLFLRCQKDKRKNYAMKLSKVLGWIDMFNAKNNCSLSFDALVIGGWPLGTLLLHSAVLLAEEPLVERLMRLGVHLSSETLALVDQDDPLTNPRKKIIDKIIRLWPPHLRMETGRTPVGQKLSGWEIASLERNWLCLTTESSKAYTTRCTDFDGGYCGRSKTCIFGHVYEPGKFPTAPTKFNDSLVEVLEREDADGKKWYTSGYADGNEFYYAAGGDGVKFEKTGIWWYPERGSAERAVRVAVTGRTNV